MELPAQLLPVLVAVGSFLLSMPVKSQQADVPNAPDPRWANVQSLQIGTPIVVRADNRDVRCKFKSAVADTVSCINSGEINLQRSTIRAVETYNRTASAGVLAIAGAGIGILMVEVGNQALGGRGARIKSTVYAGGTGMGAFIFYPIGYFTHPIQHMIYKAR